MLDCIELWEENNLALLQEYSVFLNSRCGSSLDICKEKITVINTKHLLTLKVYVYTKCCIQKTKLYHCLCLNTEEYCKFCFNNVDMTLSMLLMALLCIV